MAKWDTILDAIEAKLRAIDWPDGVSVSITREAGTPERAGDASALWLDLRPGDIVSSDGLMGAGWQWQRMAEIGMAALGGDADDSRMLFVQASALIAAALPWQSETLGGLADGVTVQPGERPRFDPQTDAGAAVYQWIVPIEVLYESDGPEG